jgi:hypothetical protein
MDNNTLWQLTAESVSEVLIVHHYSASSGSSNQFDVSEHCSLNTQLEVNVNIIKSSSRRIIKKEIFTLSSNNKSEEYLDEKVLMIR